MVCLARTLWESRPPCGARSEERASSEHEGSEERAGGYPQRAGEPNHRSCRGAFSHKRAPSGGGHVGGSLTDGTHARSKAFFMFVNRFFERVYKRAKKGRFINVKKGCNEHGGTAGKGEHGGDEHETARSLWEKSGARNAGGGRRSRAVGSRSLVPRSLRARCSLVPRSARRTAGGSPTTCGQDKPPLKAHPRPTDDHPLCVKSV